MAEEKKNIFNLHLKDGRLVRPTTTLGALSGVGKRGDLFGLVDKNTLGVFTPDDAPREGSGVPVLSGGVYEAVRARSNPNLLDNWYFGDPINQRGEKSYTGKVQTIDRWRSGNERMVLTVEDGYLNQKTNGQGTSFLRQLVELPGMDGQKLTASVMVKGTEPGHIGLTQLSAAEFEDDQHEDRYGHWTASESWTVCSATYTMQGTATHPYVLVSIRHDNNPTDGELHILAAKLEVGDRQTLAHQEADGSWVLNDAPPDRAMELARCQRYQVSIRNEDGEPALLMAAQAADAQNLYGIVSTPVTMAGKPSIVHSATVGGMWTARGLFEGEDGFASKDIISGMEVYSRTAQGVGLKLSGDKFIPGGWYTVYIPTGQKLLLDANIY